jgi:hypothetical protein
MLEPEDGTNKVVPTRRPINTTRLVMTKKARFNQDVGQQHLPVMHHLTHRPHRYTETARPFNLINAVRGPYCLSVDRFICTETAC